MTKRDDGIINKVLLDFITNDWELEDVYDVTEFTNIFKHKYPEFEKSRNVRYYLNKFTEMGILCRIKDDYNVYYIKEPWYNFFSDEFDKFNTCIW